jgi:two-component system, NtrC family, response regulator HydG
VIEDATWSLLERYPWPGNVRELRNAFIRATLLARGRPLSPDHFAEIRRSLAQAAESAGPAARSDGAGAPAASDDANDPDERSRILGLLGRCDGNRAKVARLLGMSRTTLYKKLRAYELDV